jgi:hypothetical protein
MANPLSVVVSNAVLPQPQPDPKSPNGVPLLNFSLSLDSDYRGMQAPQDARMAFAYWVIDRANPPGGLSWKFLSPNPNAVPDGIQAFMDDGHVLVFSCLALNITDVPQGPLYEFLANNGAGPVLKKIEALNTGFACGVTALGFSYTLISIPGSGTPAIEDSNHWVRMSWANALTVRADGLASQGNPSRLLYARQDRWVQSYATDAEAQGANLSRVGTDGLLTYTPAQNILVFELIPAADGKYMPVP